MWWYLFAFYANQYAPIYAPTKFKFCKNVKINLFFIVSHIASQRTSKLKLSVKIEMAKISAHKNVGLQCDNFSCGFKIDSQCTRPMHYSDSEFRYTFIHRLWWNGKTPHLTQQTFQMTHESSRYKHKLNLHFEWALKVKAVLCVWSPFQ